MNNLNDKEALRQKLLEIGQKMKWFGFCIDENSKVQNLGNPNAYCTLKGCLNPDSGLWPQKSDSEDFEIVPNEVDASNPLVQVSSSFPVDWIVEVWIAHKEPNGGIALLRPITW